MHYDFVEIGTSDFDTEVQRCKEYERGLCIEPLLTYLNRLPNKRYVHKVLAAISNKDGWSDCYYIPENVIAAHGLPWWLRGCNSIMKPHPTGQAVLVNAQLNPDEIFKTCRVPMYTVTSLFDMYQVDSINYLKVDTEGHDCVILNSYLDWVVLGGSKAKQISFESNVLTPKEDVDALINRMVVMGYEVLHRGEDTVMRYG